ncbi:FAD-binding oxidoreductase [Streptomyces sp. NPDC058773]|uniref:FAD-binding oxidoreductase n=1 Tax=Streptomyces sp. NPDC058773 TaxID=3346632 RepID=UPI00369D836E
MARDPRFHASGAGTGARGSPRTGGSTAVVRNNVDWDGLRRRMHGPLLRPGDAGFEDARKLFNPLNDDRVPAAVAQCDSAADVREAVLAAAHRVPLAARSGGHSYVGYPAPPGGLTIDLRRLSTVRVQPDGTAVIGAGTTLEGIYTALGQAKRCLPGGSCFTVGISGVALGGGIGVLQRKFGLTCDHLVSAEVVTADGRTLTASATREPDLFWALRGGGGGNFGVVTQFTFATDPAPALTVFVLHFPASAANVAKVLTGWQPWITAAPRTLWANLNVTGGATPNCRVAGCFVGPSSACNPLLNSLVSRTGVTPAQRRVEDRDYFKAMRFFSGSPSRQSFVASSRVLATPTAQPSAVVALLTGRPGMALILDALGGAVADVGVQDTAFPHRKAFATAQIYANATAATETAVTRSVGQVVAGLGDLGIKDGYVNYIDPALPDWGKAYYGPNLDRLRRVAYAYDPDQVFDFPQAIARA